MKKIRLLAVSLALASIAAVSSNDMMVVQKEKSFSQSEISIHSGDRVVFRNDDQVIHNVYSTSPGFAFEIKAQLPGQTADQRFEGQGEAVVRCAIHPQMKLKIHIGR